MKMPVPSFLLREILSKVDIFELQLMKLVSKKWLSIIRSFEHILEEKLDEIAPKFLRSDDLIQFRNYLCDFYRKKLPFPEIEEFDILLVQNCGDCLIQRVFREIYVDSRVHVVKMCEVENIGDVEIHREIVYSMTNRDDSVVLEKICKFPGTCEAVYERLSTGSNGVIGIQGQWNFERGIFEDHLDYQGDDEELTLNVTDDEIVLHGSLIFSEDYAGFLRNRISDFEISVLLEMELDFEEDW